MGHSSTSPLPKVSGPGPSCSRTTPSHESQLSEESTPLLSDSNKPARYDGEGGEENDINASHAAASLRSLRGGRINPAHTKGWLRWLRWPRWQTFIAVSILSVLVIVVIAGAFFVPTIAGEYAKQSSVIEPTSLSIESFTTTGVRARIQANFKLDASRVTNNAVRNLGQVGTWIVREVGSRESKVEVYLPEYDNLLVGTAIVPGLVVSVRNGHTTHINFTTNLEPGDIIGVRGVVNDWLEGRLGELRVLGKADVTLKSGLLSLGTQRISESLIIKGNDIPSMPQYNITRMSFQEVPLPAGNRGVAANASLSVTNDFPISLEIPPLGFDILVSNCAPSDPYIRLADATTDKIFVEPYSDVKVTVGGTVSQIPDALKAICPDSDLSPLDLLLGDYIHGNDTTIFVRGSSAPAVNVPEWITKIISSITVPVSFAGGTFGDLIRSFSLTDVHFGLPDPSSKPGTPESNPSISGNIEVLAGLPKEINFGINVSRVRGDADVFYKGKKLGVLDIKNWQPANSTRLTEDGDSSIKIVSQIKNAPLNITDQDVFGDVMKGLFVDGGVILKVKALVDVEVRTVLEKFIIRGIPGEGNVPIKPLSKGGLGDLNPHVSDIKILDTNKTSLSIQAKVNFTNPSEYTAQIPYINIHIVKNGSVIGEGTVKDLNITKGNNANVLVNAVWDPYTLGGEKAKVIGRDLMSQYISGWNTSITFKAHRGSIPSQPALGDALSKFEIEIAAPRLSTPPNGGDGDDDNSGNTGLNFIKDATFHLFSSTATFTLTSPLQENDIYIENLNATALYNHTEPIGKILYNLPFKISPGSSKSPNLPVSWSLNSVGYDRLREALGGELKLDAQGTVGIRLGEWREEVWYIGHGIGAKVAF